jgi:hypothetical protein
MALTEDAVCLRGVQGVYAVQFFKNGRWVPVLVDDRFPVSSDSYYDEADKTTYGGMFRKREGVYAEPAFAASRSRGEMWMMLIEKAYVCRLPPLPSPQKSLASHCLLPVRARAVVCAASLSTTLISSPRMPRRGSSRYAKYFGSYGAIEGGLVHLALVDLTGGSSELVKLDGEVARQEIKSGHMWSKVLMYYRSGYLLGAGSNAGRDTVRWPSCIRGVGLVRTAKQRSWCVPVWHSGDHGAGYRSWPRVRGVAS